MMCPECGKPNNDNWPIVANKKMVFGGCQDCWENQNDDMWWDAVRKLDRRILCKENNKISANVKWLCSVCGVVDVNKCPKCGLSI